MMRLIMVMMMILAAVGFTSLAVAPDFFFTPHHFFGKRAQFLIHHGLGRAGF